MIDEILKFIIAHWRVILEVLLLIISFIILLIKKRPVYNQLDEIKTELLLNLPSLINSVEIRGHGEQKLELVVKTVRVWLEHKYQFKDFDLIKDFVITAIENILSTPQSKRKDGDV